MNFDQLPAQLLLATAHDAGADTALRCRALLERAATGRELQAAFRGELARAGLTEPGFAVLAALCAQESNALLRSDLPVAAGLSPIRATDALTRLEMSGLVRRHRDPQDRRLVWLRLTPAGQQVGRDALRRCLAAAATVTAPLDAHELEASLTISAKLRQGAGRLARETAGIA